MPEFDKVVIYLHTNPLDSLEVGQTVRRGEQIATEAWRGISKSSKAHTHVEVRDADNGDCISAAKSVNHYKLDNENPREFWEAQGYVVK